MDENTDAIDENAANSENPAEQNIAEQGIVQGENEVVEQAAEEQVEAQPTRSERREQNYIDKLSEQIRNSNQPFQRNETRQEYKPLQYQEGEYDPKQLEEDRQAYGKEQLQQGMQQVQESLTPIRHEMWADRLEIDGERVKKDWPVMDEDSKEFDPDFTGEINQKFLNFIGYRQDEKTGRVTIERQNVRYSDFVRAERQNIERYASRLNENSTKNIVKQAANTGIRPNAQPRSTKTGNVDTSDPNWISKLSSKEWNEWGRDLADKEINKGLGL